ncbi:MAG: hypothetical protein A2Y62_07175 [Candidatus Fischerbacteria bacterium RBG_13_37_8]|uniref:Methyltransferase domain-containing protein n=1 Tax=Candidatus Fischerbacteria bacterium RBG_13_37_8 TaxID=1817863 RepID=A0A1F5VVR3_9BACT|nr:MAG: hypothetical protein A2Y62_07175 [Candidatus Fischerbacteria bacterium RBG_13_37_8]
MDFNDPKFKEIFFAIHSDMPREGPGNEASLLRALSFMKELAQDPCILDIGCGPGTQTVDLAQHTRGVVLGLDNHAPFIQDLDQKIAAHNLGHRMLALVGDMTNLPFRDRSFDCIWSEGAAYLMGFENALKNWKSLIKPGGYLTVTEAVWLKTGAPEPVRKLWEEYPDLKDIEANVEIIKSCGYKLVEHFTLPVEAWWENYYTPQEERHKVLRSKYAGDPEALKIIEVSQMEIDIYRDYSDYYGYEFFICRVQ